MEFVDETPSDLIRECGTIPYGFAPIEQERELKEARKPRMENKDNVRMIRAHPLSRFVRGRVPGVRVKGLETPYIIIPGRKGKKGEKVVVLGVGQIWTDQDPPITVHCETDADSDTDRGRQTVRNYTQEAVRGRVSVTPSDSEDDCGLKHSKSSVRNLGSIFDENSIRGTEKSAIFCGINNAGFSTTTSNVVDGDESLTDEMESNFKSAAAEGEVAIRKQRQKIVDSREDMVSGTDFGKQYDVTAPKTEESTDKVLTGSRRGICFQAKGKEPLRRRSTLVIQCDSDSECESVYGKRCRFNSAGNSDGTMSPSPSRPHQNIIDIEPPTHTGEFDSNPSDGAFYSGETREVDLRSLDPRTRMLKLREIFHERRRLLNMEEGNRMRVAGRGTESTRNRSDLKAYSFIEKHVMPLKASDYKIGEIPGIEVGDHFFYRVELLMAGIHRPIQGGIDFMSVTGKKLKVFDSNGKPLSVAMSVVSSRGGGYENKYEGDTLIYTGQGNIKEDQKMVRGNLALKNSCDLGLCVRVVRGVEVAKGEAPINFEGCPCVSSPSGFVYIYDGLYKVEGYCQIKSARGNIVWKFKLVRQPGQKNIQEFLNRLVRRV